MKTTLVLEDGVAARLREEAARQGRSMSELAEAALRRYFAEPAGEVREPAPLPVHDGGRLLVDVADHEALDLLLHERL